MTFIEIQVPGLQKTGPAVYTSRKWHCMLMIIFIGLVVAVETWKRLCLCSFLYLYQLVVNSIWFSRSFSVKCYLIRTVVYTEQSSQRAVFNLQAEGSCIIARQEGTSWPFFFKLIKFFWEKAANLLLTAWFLFTWNRNPLPTKAKLVAENGPAQPSRSCLQMTAGDSRICCIYI